MLSNYLRHVLANERGRCSDNINNAVSRLLRHDLSQIENGPWSLMLDRNMFCNNFVLFSALGEVLALMMTSSGEPTAYKHMPEGIEETRC